MSCVSKLGDLRHGNVAPFPSGGYLGQLVLVEGFPRTDADMQAGDVRDPARLYWGALASPTRHFSEGSHRLAPASN